MVNLLSTAPGKCTLHNGLASSGIVGLGVILTGQSLVFVIWSSIVLNGPDADSPNGTWEGAGRGTCPSAEYTAQFA